MDLSPKKTPQPAAADPHEWGDGFQLYASSGLAMQCDRCAALVRQDPGSAKRHLEWHDTVESR